VYVDPWFADRIPAFLDKVKKDINALADSVRYGERRSGLPMRRLRSAAHELGLVAVEMLILDLERALCEAELPLLQSATEELLQYVTHVQVVYRRRDDDLPLTVVA
jgi:hypothetical protein